MGGLELEVAGEFDAFAMAFLMVARQVKIRVRTELRRWRS
jgi:hypothetical protein